MAVTFHKMHGAGNDFVLFDLRRQTLELDAGRARAIAHRRTGVGCDQVLVLRAPTGSALARFEVWNADGSRAEQCGNGVRCLALYLAMQGEAGDDPFELEGPAGTIRLTHLPDGQVRVDMGRPDFRPDAIPLDLESQAGAYRLAFDDTIVEFGAVSMGNPHAVVQVEDVERAPVDSLGPALSTHPVFPSGCNVGFAEVVDRNNIRLRVFERGAGETLACGSGACAAAVVLADRGALDSEVHVYQDGGTLIIGWQGDDSTVMMTGPATHVFEGTLQ